MQLNSLFALALFGYQLRVNYVIEYIFFSQEERVFILEHFFATKYLAKVNEALQRVHPNKETPNKTTLFRVVTKCR